MNAQAEQVELIPLAEVKRVAGISKSEVWRRVRARTFPQPVKLGPLTTRWNRPEVIAWVEQRLAERDAQTAERAQRRQQRAQPDAA